MRISRRIDWPQVALVLGLATLATLLALYGPEELRAPLVGALVALAGALRGFVRAEAPADHGTGPGPGALVALLALGLAVGSSGCGASALRTHARVAVVASSALAVSHATLVETCTALRDSCAGDAACIAPHRERCEAAATAQDGARDAVDTYIGALEVAHLAGDGADVLGALMLALDVARRAWEGATRAFAALNIPLPALPVGGAP